MDSASRPKTSLLITLGAAVVADMVAAECAMGRKMWGAAGKAGLWSGDINSSTNSQFVADPYSFTHVLHGMVFYGLLWLAGRKWPAPVRALAALILESAWEVAENSDFVIDRYRAQTISLNYYGDSIVNSVSDVAAAMLGFLLAWRLPPLATLAIFLLVETAMALAVRDNLTVNVIMLIHPVQAIRAWQEHKF